MMIKLIIDVVLFSSMFAFVTGIVLAAAHVLG
jgi:ABC-type phosphate transport system permease subunit